MWIFFGVFLGVIMLYLLVLLVASLLVKSEKEYERYSPFYGWLLVSAAAIALFLGRVRVKASGLEKLPKKGRFLFVCNHLSNYDPVVVWRYLPENRVAFLCKKEVFSMPVLGKLIRKCCFRVMDRENVRNALTTISKSVELLKKGEVSIGVYPEGHRNTEEKTVLLPFHNGVFKIAEKAKVPIVVATVKSTDCIHRNFPWHRTTVYFDILEVLGEEWIEGMRTAEISVRVQELMKENLLKENKE